MKKFILFIAIFIHCLVAYSYDFEVDGIHYTITSFEDKTVAVDDSDSILSGIIEIPSSVIYSNKSFTVKSINNWKSKNVSQLLLPNTITSIAQYAFCSSSIENLFIPDNVTEIGKCAFKNCKELYSIRISKNVHFLNEYLFQGCSKLSQIEWQPENVTYGKIYGGVFFDCTSLKSFRVPNKISISGDVEGTTTNDRQTVFKNCTSLDSLIIEDGTDVCIGNWRDQHSYNEHYGEFYGCKIKYLYLGRNLAFDNRYYGFKNPVLTDVEEVIVGDSVQTTQYLNFSTILSYIPKLKRLTLGKSLTKFAGIVSDSIEYIKIRTVTPPETNSFWNYIYLHTILYVPKGTKSIYEAAPIWQNFFNIEEYYIDDEEIISNKCAKPTISYNDGIISFYSETEGATFHSSITDTDINSYHENEIQLNVTYNISVYATKLGYEVSDVATATLCWIDVEPQSEGLSNGITQIKANPILIESDNGSITIKGANDDTDIFIYGLNGQLVGSTKSQNGDANIRTNLQSGSIVIVKIGSKSVKTIIK